MKKSFLPKVHNLSLIDTNFFSAIRGRYVDLGMWKTDYPSLHYSENRNGWYVVENARTLETRVIDNQPSKVSISLHFSLLPHRLDRLRSPQKNFMILRGRRLDSLDHKIETYVWP